MTRRAKYRSSGIGVVGLMMLLSYQNCGQGNASKTSASSSSANGSVHTAPSIQDPAEISILSQVLSSYTSCEQIKDETSRNSCETTALENESGVSPVAQTKSARTETSTVGSSLFCYVIGPKCADDSQATAAPVMLLQSCRNNLVTLQGYTFEALNTYMQNDPVAYAQTINTSCLYHTNHCVVAVRCVTVEAM